MRVRVTVVLELVFRGTHRPEQWDEVDGLVQQDSLPDITSQCRGICRINFESLLEVPKLLVLTWRCRRRRFLSDREGPVDLWFLRW